MTEKSDPAIDLSECEREPICHLGLIQPHGYLLACDANLEISHASENITQKFSLTAANALGRPLSQILGARADNRADNLVREVLPRLAPGQMHHEIWPGEKERSALWAHRRGPKCILEWEPLPPMGSEAPAQEQLLADGLAGIGCASSIHRQAHSAAELTARLTGYDRVMIYQFHPDWSGEVIAEVRPNRVEPYLGLHYPASDIPPQARQLYLENLLRVIVDVHAEPVSLLSLPGESAPLDLALSQLRSVSPYHIEYLKNLKVSATVTASLVFDGALWGLIACHHDRRKTLTPWQREALAVVAKTLSANIQGALLRAKEKSRARVADREKSLGSNIPDAAKALHSILFGPERLRVLVHGCGNAVWCADGVVRLGDTPSLAEIQVYASRLLSEPADLVALDSRAALAERLGVAPRNTSLAGLIAIVVSRDPALILFAFRQETVREITWGGDINHPVLRDEQTGALSPRRSFAHYKQSVLGKATPWMPEDLEVVRIVLNVLRAAAPDPAQMARLISDGLAGIRRMIAEDHLPQHSILDAIGNGISLMVRTDAGDPTLRYANQTLLDLSESGESAGTALPTLDELLERIGLPEDLLARCASAPQPVVIETAREGLRHFLVERRLALELSDRRGIVSLTALLFNDTTRLERAREAFQAAEEKAKHLAFLKSSFLANMSHEIRTPMNGILGMVQLLQNTRKDPQQQKYLDVIQRASDVMLNLINDILDLSKIEAGRLDLDHAPFDLTAVVEGVVEMLRPRAQDKSLSLSVVYDLPPPRWYEGDALRVRQVLLNIAGNAVKFTPDGWVVIRVQGEDRLRPYGPLVITVADTGIGIPDHQLPHIFDKFHQADSSTTRKHAGSGLGLAIARELCELMGGTISLSSTVGVGSTFTITLPLRRVEDPGARATSDLLAAGSAQQPAASPGAGRRILVAEDDTTNQIVIQAMLEAQGFEVYVASDGYGALEALKQRRYDLILMDCHMPELDGYQATALIRSGEGGQRDIPIVALTASALAEDRERCLAVGMNDHMSKPIEMAALGRMLKKWNCVTEVTPAVETPSAGG